MEQATLDDETIRATGIEKLVKGLTSEFVEDPLFSMFHIMWLSEMPFAERLPYTQKLIGYIDQNVATEEGFSCLGGLKEIAITRCFLKHMVDCL